MGIGLGKSMSFSIQSGSIEIAVDRNMCKGTTLVTLQKPGIVQIAPMLSMIWSSLNLQALECQCHGP